jgi:hypothetical protein
MLAALLGVFGVFVGAFLTQIFATSAEWRSRRLEAMVEVAAASGRMIGAHERLFELFIGDTSPPLSEDRAVMALRERSDARYNWRAARARLEIVIADDPEIYKAMNEFERCLVMATKWITAYQEEGSNFRFSNYGRIDRESWVGMRAARVMLMRCARLRSQRDAQWNGRLRLKFAKKSSFNPIGYSEARGLDRS